jgi:hypothetical protein
MRLPVASCRAQEGPDDPKWVRGRRACLVHSRRSLGRRGASAFRADEVRRLTGRRWILRLPEGRTMGAGLPREGVAFAWPQPGRAASQGSPFIAKHFGCLGSPGTRPWESSDGVSGQRGGLPARREHLHPSQEPSPRVRFLPGLLRRKRRTGLLPPLLLARVDGALSRVYPPDGENLSFAAEASLAVSHL